MRKISQDTACHFIMVHGWGMGAELWQPLCDVMPTAWTHDIIEPYAQHPQYPQNQQHPQRYAQNNDITRTPRVLLTHSAGLVYALNHLQNSRWDFWIACNAFARFVDSRPYRGCVPMSELRALRQFVLRSPRDAVNRVRDRFALPVPADASADSYNAHNLVRWLDEIANWQAQDYDILSLRAGFLLGGLLDQLVPMQQNKALVDITAAGVAICESGGHILPSSHPQWCLDAITHFFSSLSGAGEYGE